MAVAIRAKFPSGTAGTTAGSGTSVTTSVTLVAGDSLVVHTAASTATDTGITLSAKLDPSGANVSPNDSSTAIHSNNQTAGFEQVFYWRAPSAGTFNVTVTATGGTPEWEQKCYALSGSDNAAPAFTTFAPTGTGVTTAASITSPSIPINGLGLGLFCAGSAFSSTGQTTECIAQNGAVTDAANAIAGCSTTGAGATVNFTATISASDWYAATAVAVSPAASATNATVVIPQSVVIHP